MELTGKKAIVTGGARGLGRALVDVLLQRGALVTVIDRDEDALQALAEARPDVFTLLCDLSDHEQVAATMLDYHARFSSADVLVNNAGVLYSAPLVRMTDSGLAKHDPAEWNRVLAADLSSVFYMTAAVVEKMMITRTRGVIVNISSVAAAGNAGQSAYSAAKAGVNALTAVWAKELGSAGIRVAAVAPGFTDIESTKAAVSESVLRDFAKKAPLRRLGRPEEIVHGIVSVIENDFFAGKVLELDGGLIV